MFFTTLIFLLISSFPVWAEGEMPKYGDWTCQLIARLTGWLPKTPPEYYFSTLAVNIADNVPFIGRGIFLEVTNIIKSVLFLVASWKIYKSLPGKF